MAFTRFGGARINMAKDIFGDAIKLLGTLLAPIKVFPDLIPESYQDPAVAVVNLSQPSDRVVKEGKKTGKYGVFRLSVVANANDDVISILDTLESLDNTRQGPTFQLIRLDVENIEPKEPGQPVRRAFVTFTAYP